MFLSATLRKVSGNAAISKRTKVSKQPDWSWTNSVLLSGASRLDSEAWDSCKASQGNEYHEPLPVPCRATWRFSTRLRKWSFNVLRLAPVARIMSAMVTRPCWRT